MVLNHGEEWVAPSSSATSLHLYVVLVISILKSQEKQRQAQQKVQSWPIKGEQTCLCCEHGEILTHTACSTMTPGNN